MKFHQLLLFFTFCSLLSVSLASYSQQGANQDSRAYPKPLTLENISEKDKKNPAKVPETLANTFLSELIGGYQKKEYTKEEISQAVQLLTNLTCIQYSRLRQIEKDNPATPMWKVKAVWFGPYGHTAEDFLQLKASTKDLATGYAMCSIWNMKDVPLDRFSGFHVELVNDNAASEE
ncbi:hypothetical protein [Microbulbifer epialgicus]|uniref:Uncharacterized protein n=1 Tax=Microbulbifer epialgicus TaxID=393907 RepID=A0ABV4NVB8_9GAMM